MLIGVRSLLDLIVCLAGVIAVNSASATTSLAMGGKDGSAKTVSSHSLSSFLTLPIRVDLLRVSTVFIVVGFDLTVLF